MPRRKKVYGNCPYCGEFDKLTRDHVIPECLFPEDQPLPGDLPKIRACALCNNQEKSGNDTYLRDFLSLDIDNEGQPTREQIYPKFMRAVQRNQSVFAHHVQRSQLIELQTPSGLFARFAYGIRLPDERITKELATIVRGLYYAYVGESNGTILPETTPFDIYRHRDMTAVATDIGVLMQMGGRYVPVGDGSVFECAYGCADEKPEVSLWYLNFYRRVVFSVSTNRRGTPGNIR